MPSKKKAYDNVLVGGWFQDYEEEGHLYGQNKNYSRQAYDQDMLVSSMYPIFDDKQIKQVLKGIQIKDQLTSPTQVHQNGAKIVPIFCKQGYGVNFVKEQLPEFHQLTPDRYKTIIKAVIRRGIRVLESVIGAGEEHPQYKLKMSNYEYNQIVTPLMHSQKRMPVTFRTIFYKLLKQSYGVGPTITKEQGRKLYTVLKYAANNKGTFFQNPDNDQEELDEKFRALALKSAERREGKEKTSKSEFIKKKKDDGDKKKKKSKKQKEKQAKTDFQSIQQEGESAENSQRKRNEFEGADFYESEQEEQSSSRSHQDTYYDDNYHANNYWESRHRNGGQKRRRGESGNGRSVRSNANWKELMESNKKKFQQQQLKQQQPDLCSTDDDLIWPDEVEFCMYELLIEKFSYRTCCQSMIKRYPQNSDYFTPLQLQQEIEKKVSKIFKDIVQKYTKVGIKQTINQEKQNSSAKPISLFLMFKSHYNKIFRFLMRSSHAKQPRRNLLKLYLAAIKQAASTPGQNVNTMTFDVSKNDILQLQKDLNASFEKKISSDNIKQQQFNGDYDEFLETDTNDYEFRESETYRFRVNAKKPSSRKVDFQEEQKLFLSQLQNGRDWNEKETFDFLKQKNTYDDVNDKEKDIEDYLRQPVKKSITKQLEEELANMPKPRKRNRKQQSSNNRRVGTDRAKTKGRTYKSIMKNPDILDELSGSEYDEHDEYDWFHNEEMKSQQNQKYGGLLYNDYGYDNRGVLPSLGFPKKGLMIGSKSYLKTGRILGDEDDGDGGIIEID